MHVFLSYVVLFSEKIQHSPLNKVFIGQMHNFPCPNDHIKKLTALQLCISYPLIIAKDSSLEKYEDPGTTVTVSFPALIKSGSSSPGRGNLP